MGIQKEYNRFATTFGPMLIAGDKAGLTQLVFEKQTRNAIVFDDMIFNPQSFVSVIKEIQAYFLNQKPFLELQDNLNNDLLFDP